MDMKKIMAGLLIIMLFAASAAGACFFLRKGAELSRESEKPVLEGIRDITVEAGEELPDLRKGLKANRAVKGVTVDASGVDTRAAGIYEILYYYTDASGKRYCRKASCTVTDNEDAPPEQEGQRPDGEKERKGEAAQEEVKTGDEIRVACYVMLAAFSLGMFAWGLRQRHLCRE